MFSGVSDSEITTLESELLLQREGVKSTGTDCNWWLVLWGKMLFRVIVP